LKVSVSGSARAVMLLLAGVSLAGCGLFAAAAPPTFDLTAPTSGFSGSTSAQILVPESTALQTLDSQRILVVAGSELSYYPDAQWPDDLPRVIQARLIEALGQSGRAHAAGRPGQGLSIDYRLLTDIRAFQYEVGAGGGTAVVTIFAQLMDDRNGRVVAGNTFNARVPIAADTAVAVTAGLNTALRQALTALVNWTLARI
jgi:cholesterol transport system auxiliary component